MNDNHSSGILGIFGLLGCLLLFFVFKRFFPTVATVLLSIGGIVLLLVVILVVLIIVFAFSKPKNTKTGAPAEDANAILAKGRASVIELRRRTMRIKNDQVRTQGEEICKASDQILRTLKEQPENISQVRQFLNYYLPTLGNILSKYARLEESGAASGEMTINTITCLRDIQTAMEKLYANLFEDDILDLTVEMETLALACKRDGLLDDEAVQLQEEGKDITLTL
ncbi:MAG: 5-bromo-4-chloroindolyl phosphate hydrolysis family protein [Lachnospiraceae bacterium]|nr:5-bromo-4-chloroindolyl phosphate hydrolysis family protein [Lachnospiraceae bacterium]